MLNVSNFSGITSINKPTGLSSSDAVIKCRNSLSKALGGKVKCGHLGTLDPYACGVLIVAFGKATRLFDYLPCKIKTYFARFTFGVTTDTLDSEGEIVGRKDLPLYEDLLKVLPSFVGICDQIPPQYSAVSVNGKRAYALARSGQTVEIASKKIVIDKLTVVRHEVNEVGQCLSVDLEIKCGSGTYIRSLCRDIAEACNSVGYMAYLIRTKNSDFDINNSPSIEDFCKNPTQYVTNIDKYVAENFDRINFEDELAKKIFNGVPIELNSGNCEFYILEKDTQNNLSQTNIESDINESLKDKIFAVSIKNKLLGLAKITDGKTSIIANLWDVNEEI